MTVTPPFWFKQRQAKLEESGPGAFKVTAPNQQEAYLAVREVQPGQWGAALRLAPDGPDLAASEPTCPTPDDAWTQAFELYRTALVI